jgi:hypothetical protein
MLGFVSGSIFSATDEIHKLAFDGADESRKLADLTVFGMEVSLKYMEEADVFVQNLNQGKDTISLTYNTFLGMTKSLMPVAEDLDPALPGASETLRKLQEWTEFEKNMSNSIKTLGVFNLSRQLDAFAEVTSATKTSLEPLVKDSRELKDTVYWCTDYFKDFTNTVSYTVYIAAPGTFLVLVGIVVNTVVKWRQIRLKMATGEMKRSPTYSPKLYHPVKAPQLPGLMASSALIGFFICLVLIIVLIFLARILVFLLFELDDDATWDWVGAMFVSFGSSMLVKSFIFDTFLGRKVLVGPLGFVLYWQTFTWYIVFMMPINITKSFVLGATRFLYLIVLCAAYVVSLDVTLFPDWLQSFDSGHCAFMASVLLDHRHRNPVWTCMLGRFRLMHIAAMENEDEIDKFNYHVSRLDEDEKSALYEHQKGMEARDLTENQRRIAKKWQFARTLANNPSLMTERKREKQEAYRAHHSKASKQVVNMTPSKEDVEPEQSC